MLVTSQVKAIQRTWAKAIRAGISMLLIVPIIQMSSITFAASVTGENLLDNESFELGLTGWTVTPPLSSVVDLYGQSGVTPQLAVSERIDGGANILRSAASSSVVEQIVVLPQNRDGLSLLVGAYVGGVGASSVAYDVRARFDCSDGTSVIGDVKGVNVDERNHESVVMVRQRVLTIPALATQVAIQLRLAPDPQSCCGFDAMADKVFAVLVEDTLPTKPIGVELVHNPGFESGWTDGSPLDLNDPDSWVGVASNPVEVIPYGLDDSVPGVMFSDFVDGGGAMVRHIVNNASADCGIRQVIDLRGNTASDGTFPGLRLRVSALLGGRLDYSNTVRLKVKFIKENLGAIKLAELGPVSYVTRNFETILMKFSEAIPIPNDTAFVELALDFDYLALGFLRDAIVDNVSAVLELESQPKPAALGVNLVKNGSFDSQAAWIRSPLTPNETSGWTGSSDVLPTAAVAYGELLYDGGAVGKTPPNSFATTKKLGPKLLASDDDFGAPPSKSHASIRQTVDLTGLEVLIDKGWIQATASAWLGVASPNTTDAAEVRIMSFDADDHFVASTETKVLGPVSSIDLSSGIGLAKRKQKFAIAPTTRRLVVEVWLANNCCGFSSFGLADDIRIELSSTHDLKDLSPNKCDSGKVKAMASFSKSRLLAYSKSAASDPLALDVGALSASLTAAEVQLIKDFDNAEANAVEAGGECSVNGGAVQMFGTSSLAIEQVYLDIMIGHENANKHDRKLRATLLKLAAALYKEYYVAESTFIKNWNGKSLASKRAKSLKTFVKKATQAIAAATKKGVIYSAATPSAIAAVVDLDVETTIGTLH